MKRTRDCFRSEQTLHGLMITDNYVTFYHAVSYWIFLCRVLPVKNVISLFIRALETYTLLSYIIEIAEDIV